MIILGDCLVELKKLADNSVDAVVTDPPYGLKFMGKKWDYDVPSVEIWQECLRVLKPGGYLLSFAGTRTQHRMAVRIEDAGFEIRDMIAWVYGSGFPKSLNIGKAVDKIQGNEREVLGERKVPDQRGGGINSQRTAEMGVPTRLTQDTKGTSEWEGWGTALKPALEPITVARKPIEGTVALNCLKWGVGGINIDGCRVEGKKPDTIRGAGGQHGKYSELSAQGKIIDDGMGRFPANLIHDGSDEVVGLFPQTKSGAMNSIAKGNQYNTYGKMYERQVTNPASEGSASRFFYCAKASKSERNRGCENMSDSEPAYKSHRANYKNTHGIETPYAGTGRSGKDFKNFHPTVKPVSLMEYLVKLVSKEGHTILDPFMGSGSTGIACKKLGREFIGIELEPDYVEIAKARIESYEVEPEQVALI